MVARSHGKKQVVDRISIPSISMRWRGPMLMLTSAFLFAGMDSFIKLLGPPFRLWDIAFYRFGFGLVILLCLFGWKRNPFRSNDSRLLVVRGVVGCMAFLALVIAIRLIPISTALVLFFAYPAFAAVFSTLLFKESIRPFEIFCVALTFCGVIFLLDFSVGSSPLGQLVSLSGAALAGIAVTIIKKLRETNGPVIIYLYFCLLGTVIVFPSFISNPQIPQTPYEWFLIIGIMVSSLLAQLLMNQGFHYCKSWEGGVFLTSEVIFTSLFGIFFLSEIVTWHFWLGGSLILTSIIALNWGNNRRISFRGIAPPDLEAQ